jgi:hypothetical protein
MDQEADVRQEGAQGVLAGELAGVTKARDQVYCKHCGSHQVFRIFREGYLQEKIYPLFGFYPWRCKACRTSMMLHKRKLSRSKDKEYLE